ncbi:hypothetical protein [Sphingobium sp. HWE2-09]|uniref:hypothetical protein n=1 Tax=Sphingobium sp. HWE2-09 TaxID=3108390 RepID=UPI002DC58B8D|nr:hypothetical protein [Sphingobium sp. HWE2-09]
MSRTDNNGLADFIGRNFFGLDLLRQLAEPSKVRRQIEAGAVVSQNETELLVADGSRRLTLFAGQLIDVTEEDALLRTLSRAGYFHHDLDQLRRLA